MRRADPPKSGGPSPCCIPAMCSNFSHLPIYDGLGGVQTHLISKSNKILLFSELHPSNNQDTGFIWCPFLAII